MAFLTGAGWVVLVEPSETLVPFYLISFRHLVWIVTLSSGSPLAMVALAGDHTMWRSHITTNGASFVTETWPQGSV